MTVSSTTLTGLVLSVSYVCVCGWGGGGGGLASFFFPRGGGGGGGACRHVMSSPVCACVHSPFEPFKLSPCLLSFLQITDTMSRMCLKLLAT